MVAASSLSPQPSSSVRHVVTHADVERLHHLLVLGRLRLLHVVEQALALPKDLQWPATSHKQPSVRMSHVDALEQGSQSLRDRIPPPALHIGASILHVNASKQQVVLLRGRPGSRIALANPSRPTPRWGHANTPPKHTTQTRPNQQGSVVPPRLHPHLWPPCTGSHHREGPVSPIAPSECGHAPHRTYAMSRRAPTRERGA